MAKTYTPRFYFWEFLDDDEVQNRITTARIISINGFRFARDPKTRERTSVYTIVGCDTTPDRKGRVPIDGLARRIVQYASAFMLNKLFSKQDLDRDTRARYSLKEQELIVTEMRVQVIIGELVRMRDASEIYVLNGIWEMHPSVVDEVIRNHAHPTRVKNDDRSWHGRPNRDRVSRKRAAVA